MHSNLAKDHQHDLISISNTSFFFPNSFIFTNLNSFQIQTNLFESETFLENKPLFFTEPNQLTAYFSSSNRSNKKFSSQNEWYLHGVRSEADRSHSQRSRYIFIYLKRMDEGQPYRKKS